MIRRLIIFVAVAGALRLAPQAALAEDLGEPGAVVQALAARTAHVSAYHADLHLHIRMHSFPYIAVRLSGATTYQRPDKYQVQFRSVPALARGYEKVSGDVGDPAGWRRKYDIIFDRPVAAEPHVAVLRLTEKVRGEIDHALAFVDLNTMTVQRMEWFYYHGGHIALDQHYADVDGVLLVDRQEADIAMPTVKARAWANIGGYSVQTDVAGPASVRNGE